MGTLADIPFLSGYNEQDRINRGRENTDLDRAGAIQGLLAKMQAQKAQQAIIGVMSSNAPMEVKLQQVMRLPGGIEVAGKLAQMQEHQAKARQIGIPKPAEPYTLSPGSQRFGPDNAPLASVPPTPHAPPVERFSNLNRLLKEAQDPSLTPEQRATYVNAIRKESETVKQISPTVVMPRAAPQLHFERTVDDDGSVKVHAFDQQGNLVKSTAPGGKTPSFLSNENVRERQLSTALETVKKPHLEVLNAYQRYEQIKGTGDNAQANQFLAQQLMQMSRTGQRALPKAELERILGSGDLGNDWIGRAANMVTQMAAGVRTPTIDKRLNDLADAMAKGSADRIGQEIQNTRARTPPGVLPERVVGATPTIYGRFIITPTGKVHAFKNSAEAQAKLDEASKVMGQ